MSELTMPNSPAPQGETGSSQHGNQDYGLIQGIGIILVFAVLFIGAGLAAGKYFVWNSFDKSSKLERDFKSNLENVQADPNNPLYHVQLGWSYFLKKDNEQAVGEYTKALSLDPKSYAAKYDLGLAYLQLKQYDNAAASLNDAISIVPKAFPPHLNLAIAYINLEKYDDALKELSNAYMSNPGSPETMYWRGVVYEKKGKNELAFQQYEAAINFDPGFKDAQAAYERVKKNLKK